MPPDLPAVLFLCTGNSCRSQMAEALLRHHAPHHFRALSAGTDPAPEVHPMSLEALIERGIDTTGLTPKSIASVLSSGIPITHAITVCDHARQSCPTFPAAVLFHHWPFDDPAHFEGSPESLLTKFCQTRDLIERRILTWLDSQPRS